MTTGKREREDLARYLLQHSADNAPPQLTAEAQAWGEKEAFRVLSEQNAEYKAVISEIYVNVREIRKSAIGKDAETISDIFHAMVDEILAVTIDALKDSQ